MENFDIEKITNEKYNSIVILGPTAVGKTALGVQTALATGGQIISADSRQVYTGLDIGSGKDLKDYDVILDDGTTKHIPYHLIDICTLEREYSVADYQKDFYDVFKKLRSQNVLPIVVGGTGMYVDAIIRDYDFVPCPVNEELRKWAETKTTEELAQTLIAEKKKMHNTTELTDRETIIKALEIYRFNISEEHHRMKKELDALKPEVKPIIFGTTAEREVIRARIEKRLDERLEEGMIEEVENLHKNGVSYERLERLGLEYRFISEYLEGKYKDLKEMRDLLYIAIRQFAKRQETWFRFMEKNGVNIHWLDKNADTSGKLSQLMDIMQK